jgi:hypothetical protein
MARTPVVRLAAAALVLVALASCSKDEPEAVGTNGGLELSSTTTEQPRITEPRPTTTTSTTTTTTEAATTTTSTTTTTNPVPVVPAAEELLGILPPVEALPGGDWARSSDGLTEPAAAGAETSPLCTGAGAATPLGPMIYEGAATGGGYARYERPDESSRILLTVAPVTDAPALVAAAQTAIAGCTTGPQAATVLGWEPLGDASLAFSLSQTDGTTSQSAIFVIAHVGQVVVALNLQSYSAVGQEMAPAPTEAEVQAFVGGIVAGVAALG